MNKTIRFLLIIFFFMVSSQIFSLSLEETISALKETQGAAGKTVEFRWDPFFQSGIFSLGDHFAAFSTTMNPGEDGFLLLDGRDLYSVSLPYPDKGELFFPELFTASLKSAFARSIAEDASRYRIAAIIIDPGHGGKDSGADSRDQYMIRGKSQKIYEKDVVLAVSKQLSDLLVKAFPGKRILLTRDRDIFPSLGDRTDLANAVPLKDNEAIIFVSVHANASLNKNARGYEVWYLPPDFRRELLDPMKYADSADVLPILNDMLQEEYTTESILMGKSILNAFSETLGKAVPNRGLKAQDWYVVRNSRMPAVLVELGFVSNREDVQLMTSENGLQKYAEALYKGVAEFIGVFERSGGFTAVR